MFTVSPALRTAISEPVRVAIVDKYSGMRAGLRQMIETSPDVRCAGVFQSAEQAVAAVKGCPFDVLLLDERRWVRWTARHSVDTPGAGTLQLLSQ
jgi:DNA-binding NarL/FixJ family response regulator